MKIFVRRLIIFLISVVAVFLIVCGFYFYDKASHRKPPQARKDTEVVYDTNNIVVLKELLFDFEENSKTEPTSSENSFSGLRSCKFSPDVEYGCNVAQLPTDIYSYRTLRQVEVSFRLFNTDDITENIWVIQLDGAKDTTIYWNGELFPEGKHKWENITLTLDLKPADVKKSVRVKTYVWNRNKNTFFVDNVRIRFLGFLPYKSPADLALKKSSYLFDLENDSSLEKTYTLSNDFAHSGKRSSFMNGKNEYSVSVCKRLGDVTNDSLKNISAGVWLYPLSDHPECTLITEVRTSDGEQTYWNGKSTQFSNLKANQWQKLNASFNLSSKDYSQFNTDDKICVYVENNSSTKLYADDFEVSYGNIPDRPGDRTYTDMNTAEGGAYEFDRYHPPYRFSSLQQKNIQNDNSDFLVKTSSGSYGKLNPNQFIVSGNFSGIERNKDELLAINDNVAEIFHYCSKEERFTLVCRNDFPRPIASDAIYITGDFNGDGKKELLITDKSNSTLIDFSCKSNNGCGDEPEIKHSNIIWSSAPLVNKNSTAVATDLNGDGLAELVISDDGGKYYRVLSLKKTGWFAIAEGSLPEYVFGKNSALVSGKFLSSTHEVILSSYKENGVSRLAFISLEGDRLSTKPVLNEKMLARIFSPSDILYPIHTPGQSTGILQFNLSWRFDLKLVRSDKDGFYVASVPEFTGYASDQNPKYYEFPKVISGNFTGSGSSLICILYNCADKNFDGKNCKEFESVKDLPNSIQFYTFENGK